MVYLSKADILARIKAENLEVITGGDDTLLSPHELDAVDEVKSYLAHDYDIDLVFQPVETADYKLNATIKRMTIDLLLYGLHNSRVNPRNIPENIVQKRDDAVTWLKSVANPRTNINAPFLPKKQFEGKRNNEMAWGSRSKQKNDY
jgi:phage gp36-like protein